MPTMNDSTTITLLEWFKTHYKLPKSGLWFICKVKSSDDLKLICGFENVTKEQFDAYAEVICPL